MATIQVSKPTEEHDARERADGRSAHGIHMKLLALVQKLIGWRILKHKWIARPHYRIFR
jgi:hypothetical protein